MKICNTHALPFAGSNQRNGTLMILPPLGRIHFDFLLQLAKVYASF